MLRVCVYALQRVYVYKLKCLHSVRGVCVSECSRGVGSMGGCELRTDGTEFKRLVLFSASIPYLVDKSSFEYHFSLCGFSPVKTKWKMEISFYLKVLIFLPLLRNDLYVFISLI